MNLHIECGMVSVHLNLYMHNAYTVVIPIMNSFSYETKDLWNLGCMEFLGGNSSMNETRNSGIIEFNSISVIQHLDFPDIHQTLILEILVKKQAP